MPAIENRPTIRDLESLLAHLARLELDGEIRSYQFKNTEQGPTLFIEPSQSIRGDQPPSLKVSVRALPAPSELVRVNITISDYQKRWLAQHPEVNLSQMTRGWIDRLMAAYGGES